MFGNIFNVQKFSIHDGPGIRTTVFFKGCPLRCKWCSNPESQRFTSQVNYEESKCSTCHLCVSVCPNKCISIKKSGAIKIDHEKCKGCATCINNCPNKALKITGKLKSVEEIVDKCLQDIDFYLESNGGVTLSGGECFYQKEFVKELIKELKKHNIHIAAETTGYIKEEDFKELASLFDLLLFDVKQYDPIKHKSGTGVSNEVIIRNLKWAQENNIKILPRIPVIPGFNNELSDAKGLASLLKEIGLKEVQLLPFHQFGERKYELLDEEYALKDIKALYPEDLKEYQQVFINEGLNCYF